MARTKLPPRLYFNESRKRWVIRYEHWMRRTPFSLEQKPEAEALLQKILGEKSWAHSVRALQPKPRKTAVAPWARSKTMGLIYFVSCEETDNYPIKIGFCAGSIEKRLCELQVGNPHPLEVLATTAGTFAQEQGLHLALAAHRVCGEWFRRCEPVERVLGAAMNGQLFHGNHFCAETVQSSEIS